MSVSLAKPLAIGTVVRATSDEGTVSTAYITQFTRDALGREVYTARSVYTGRYIIATRLDQFRVITETRLMPLVAEALGWLQDCGIDTVSDDPAVILREVGRYHELGTMGLIQSFCN